MRKRDFASVKLALLWVTILKCSTLKYYYDMRKWSALRYTFVLCVYKCVSPLFCFRTLYNHKVWVNCYQYIQSFCWWQLLSVSLSVSRAITSANTGVNYSNPDNQKHCSKFLHSQLECWVIWRKWRTFIVAATNNTEWWQKKF